jgi:hypothetical protein
MCETLFSIGDQAVHRQAIAAKAAAKTFVFPRAGHSDELTRDSAAKFSSVYLLQIKGRKA